MMISPNTMYQNPRRMSRTTGFNCQIKEYTENPKGKCNVKHVCKMDCQDVNKPECTTSREQKCFTVEKEKCSMIRQTVCPNKNSRTKRTIVKFLEAKRNLLKRLFSKFGKKDAENVPRCQVVNKNVCTFEPEEVCTSQPTQTCITKNTKECSKKCEKTWICTECITTTRTTTTTTPTTTTRPITTPLNTCDNMLYILEAFNDFSQKML